MKTFLAAFAAFILAFGTVSAQVEYRYENVRVVNENKLDEISSYALTELMTITFGGGDTYTIGEMRVTPQGGARNVDFYTTIYILAEDGKVIAISDKQGSSGDYDVPVNIVVTKGVPKKIRFAVKTDYWGNNPMDLEDIAYSVQPNRVMTPNDFGLSMFAHTNWYGFTFKGGGNINLSAVDADIKPEVRIGELAYFGGVRFDAWGESVFMLQKPTFRLYLSKGKATDIVRLELVDELGRVVATKPKITNYGEYVLVEFPDAIKVVQGTTSYYFRGKLGRTFKGGGTATLVAVTEDFRSPLGLSGKVFSIELWSRIISLGSVKVK